MVFAFWFLVLNLPVCTRVYPTVLHFEPSGDGCRAPLPTAGELLHQFQADPFGCLALLAVSVIGLLFLAVLLQVSKRVVGLVFGSAVATLKSVWTFVKGTAQENVETARRAMGGK